MATSGMVAPVSVKTAMSYDDSKADDFERKSMGSDDGSDDYKVRHGRLRSADPCWDALLITVSLITAQEQVRWPACGDACH